MDDKQLDTVKSGYRTLGSGARRGVEATTDRARSLSRKARKTTESADSGASVESENMFMGNMPDIPSEFGDGLAGGRGTGLPPLMGDSPSLPPAIRPLNGSGDRGSPSLPEMGGGDEPGIPMFEPRRPTKDVYDDPDIPL